MALFLSLRSKPLEELAPGGALLPWREPLAAWSGSHPITRNAREMGTPGIAASRFFSEAA
jgi:hypothetical protein